MTTTTMLEDDSKKRKLEEGDNEEERKRNSLRYDDANLKVIVGGEQGDGEDDGEKGKGDNSEGTNKEMTTGKKVFWHYGHILASHSRYVDTLLAVPLSAASTTNKDGNNNDDDDDIDKASSSNNITEISFPDISPSQWKRMMNFITDPAASRNMSQEDAMELTTLYDKYDFHTGLKLCDEVLSSMFKDHMNDLMLLDRCVQGVVLSHEKNLKKTFESGMLWLVKLFQYEPEYMILTVDHIRKLMPIVVYYCKEETSDVGSIVDQINSRLDTKNIDILNPMFPDFFVSQIQLIVAQNTTLKLVNEIDISDCAQVVGTYYAVDDDDGPNNIGDTCMYYKDNMDTLDRFLLKKNDVGDWIIQHLPDRDVPEGDILFICKHSRCKSLPPKTGWEKMGGDNDVFRQRNLPMFSYYHNSDTGRKEITI